MDEYEATIGLEVHVQLKTASKMFCGCRNVFGAAPNTFTCPICLGHPGTLPAPNREALRLAVRAAAALVCDIPDFITLDRKNYFYPDLPKGFQISQHFSAVGRDGTVTYWSESGFGTVAVERVHLEEDVARGVHDEVYVAPDETLLDFNRAGVPLMEVVSRPVITSATEARRYIVALRQTLIEAGVSDCDMEKGAFRIDTNISVKKKTALTLGEQVEVKNLNSIRAMEAALQFECRRQVGVLRNGGRIRRETRLFDEETGETRTTRAKELRADYRFFPEPDIRPIALTTAFVDAARAGLGAPPAGRIRELQEDFAATLAEAEMVVFSGGYYDFLQDTAAAYGGERRALLNWLVGDVTRELNARGWSLAQSRLEGKGLAALLTLLDAGEVNVPAAREVLTVLMVDGGDPTEIIVSKSLGQVSDRVRLETFVREAFVALPKALEDLKAGREKAKSALVGYVMKKTAGRANPAIVNDAIDRILAEN